MNIIRIFASDARRIWTNVVALVVILGLAVIPSLYAWFNILSNWDPYGEKATSNLKVAVVSEDEGTEIDGVDLNIGTIVINNLKENKSIDWQFSKRSVDAVEGVTSGKYYAALVIDKNFSKDMLSFIGGDTINPKIHYYENEKLNAIAPKITGKVKTTVQNEVNAAFVGTLTEGVLTVSKYAAMNNNGETDLTTGAVDRLKTLDGDMTVCVTILDSYISLTETSENLMKAAGKVSNEMSEMIATAGALSTTAQTTVNAADQTLGTTSDMVVITMSNTENKLAALKTTIDSAMDTENDTVQYSSSQMDALISVADGIIQETETSIKDYVDTSEDLKDKNQKVVDSYAVLKGDMSKLEGSINTLNSDSKALADSINADIDNLISEIDALMKTYVNTVKPSITNSINSVRSSLLTVQKLVGDSTDSISNLSAVLGSYPDMMGMGKEKLQDSKAKVLEMQGKLEDLISKMDSLDENEQYKMLIKLLEKDPDTIADFISEPTEIKTIAVYKIKNNGSATAPFYITLSIWVGALILVAIIHTKIKDRSEFPRLKTFEEFFGRYLIFFAIGQIQTLITVFGALFYVGIQCKHGFLFWVACAFTSFVYTILLYALTYAFGAVGEAIAVVLMVIQVAGSGGTFPIEVLPKVFQVLYEYMPFNYSMNAIRECIGGMHGRDYAFYLTSLSIYIGVALLIGLILSIPLKRLNRKVEKMKEETGIMA